VANDVKLDNKTLQQAARDRLAAIPQEIADLKTARTKHTQAAKQCTADIAALEVKTKGLSDFVEVMELKVKTPRTRKPKTEAVAPDGAEEEGASGNPQ
jgi:hypothetical protein